MADAIITMAARTKMVKARAGDIKLPKIVGFVFGDGGTDENGAVISPSETDSGLRNQLYKKQIDGFEYTSATSCRYSCTLQNHELVDAKINEIGLYDEDGDIIAIKTFRNKEKDDDFEMTFDIEDIF